MSQPNIKAPAVKCKICGKDAQCDDPDEPNICNKCFHCPNCGATPSGPAKTKTARAKVENGTWNHKGYCVVEDVDAQVECSVCEKGWGYRAFEKALMKKENRKACPMCKGCGTVKA